MKHTGNPDSKDRLSGAAGSTTISLDIDNDFNIVAASAVEFEALASYARRRTVAESPYAVAREFRRAMQQCQ